MIFRILFGMESGPLAFDVLWFLGNFDTPETSIEISVSVCLMVLCSTSGRQKTGWNCLCWLWFRVRIRV